MVQLYGRSFEASTAHQIPICPMKLCPITVEQSPIPSPRLKYSSTITPELASSTLLKKTVISTAVSKKVSTLCRHHICRQWKLHLTQNVWTIVSNSEGETQRSCWSRQHATNIPQITWSFSSPGTAFRIQFIIPPSRLSMDLKNCCHNPIAKSW